MGDTKHIRRDAPAYTCPYVQDIVQTKVMVEEHEKRLNALEQRLESFDSRLWLILGLLVGNLLGIIAALSKVFGG